MRCNYFYKKASDNSFEYTTGKIALREYKPQLVFYQPFNDLRAEFAIYDKLPYVAGKTEIRNHGAFGSCLNVLSPVKYENKNFDILQDKGTISFWALINNFTGVSRQTIFLDKWQSNNEAGDYSFTLRVGRESVKPVVFHLDANATGDDIRNTLLVELDPDIFKAELDNEDTENITIKSTYTGEIVELSAGTSGTNLLDVLDTGNRRFGCYPQENQKLVELSSDNQTISFVHESVDYGSYLKVYVYNNKQVVAELSTLWENDGVSMSNIEFAYNDEIAYLFLDGKLVDFKKTGFIKEEKSELIIYGTEDNPYTYDELIIFSKVQHTTSFNVATAALTKYSTERPHIDFYWKAADLTSNSIKQCIITGSNNLHFIVSTDEKYYYYMSGSWRESNGSFSESNDIGTFLAKIGDFVFSGSEVRIRVIFNSDGSSPAYIEDIYFELSEEDIYGDDAEAPAILVGIPEIVEPLDLYGKKLIIQTDKGTTEIEFTGDTDFEELDDCCSQCEHNDSIDIRQDNEELLIRALKYIENVHLYSHIILTSPLMVLNSLVLEDGCILDLNMEEIMGQEGSRLVIMPGAMVTGNGVNMTQAGTYIWTNGTWQLEAYQTEVTDQASLVQALGTYGSVTVKDTVLSLTDFTLEAGQTLTVGTGSDITFDTAFNVQSGAILNVVGDCTIEEETNFVVNGIINVRSGTFEKRPVDNPFWDDDNQVSTNGIVNVYSGATAYEGTVKFIGTDETAYVKLTYGNIDLSYDKILVKGEATVNDDLLVQDPVVVATGGQLTIAAGKQLIFGEAVENEHPSGGSIQGEVVTG